MGQEGNKRGKGKPSGGAVASVPDLRIEYMDLASLVRAPRNPKRHDLGALHTSLSRFGFVNPILLDDRTGQIVAGHGRLDTLQQLKAGGGPPPKRVKALNNSWLIPVIRGVTFDSDIEAEGYLLADNQTTILGGWDDAQLAEMLSDLAAQGAMEGTGFDGDDLDKLLFDLNPHFEPVGEDQQGRLDQKKPVTCPGCGLEFVPKN